MALFKDVLGSGESLFKNSVALDFDYQPKLIQYREREQRIMASCIKPLFQDRNGRNLFIYGLPGIGKTVACKHVIQEIEEETDEIYVLYVNCWQKNTTFKILMELCDLLGYKFTQNKKTEELFDVVKNILNKKSAVFVFDEVDKLSEIDFLYSILEDIYKKSIIIITNEKNWVISLDERIKSRLMAEMLEFRTYNDVETKGILKLRAEYAFIEDCWDARAFDLVCKKTFELKDIRSGLYLLREAGNIAEEKSSRKISLQHVEDAIKKLDEFKIKNKEDLDDAVQDILQIIKENSGKRIGEIYTIYNEKKGKIPYKTFQRKIRKLELGKFVIAEKIHGGKEGQTTILRYFKP